MAKAPYIRESRRIEAELTVVEQHVGTEARRRILKSDHVQAESFPDSVGVGSYRIDLHPSTGGDNYIDISSLPFQIPLGALIPKRVENLLPACKNLGTTHITNGCYPAASRRVVDRRSRRRAGCVLPRRERAPACSSQLAQAPECLPIPAGRPGRRDCVAATDAAIAKHAPAATAVLV